MQKTRKGSWLRFFASLLLLFLLFVLLLLLLVVVRDSGELPLARHELFKRIRTREE